MGQLMPGENFEPSRDTKLLWRYTHKAGVTAAGVYLPGLFQTAHELWDCFGFCLVLILETWGLVNLLLAGAHNILYAAGIIALDLVLAYARHAHQGRLCENRNRLVFEMDPGRQAALQAQINRDRWLPWVCALGIWVVALFKVVSFYGLEDGGVTGLTLAILVSYAVTAFLHLYATGHFLFLMAFKLRWMLDRARFEHGVENGGSPRTIRHHRVHAFIGPSSMIVAAVDGHELLVDARGEVPPEGCLRFLLRTWGVLTDGQLQTLLHFQTDATAKGTLAREGVQHQLANILRAE